MRWADRLYDIEGLHVLEPRDQYDPCIIGVVERGNSRFVLYSKTCILRAIIAEEPDEDDAEQNAIDHFEFNILGSWVGDDTPGFLNDGAFGD